MRLTSSMLLAGTATSVSAQIAAQPHWQGYIHEICTPLNSSNLPDMNAPCNALQAIQAQCLYGPDEGLAIFYDQYNTSYVDGTGDDDSDDDDDGPAEQDNRTQQVCACESQMFELLAGCTACSKAHGSPDLAGFLGPDLVSSISSEYCVATATPSVDLASFLYQYAEPTAIPSSIRSQQSAAMTSSFSDPIGNKTAVSYYFTPSVTGSAAWVVAEATGSAGTSGPGSFSTISTSGGQIVPTAVVADVSATGKPSSSVNTTSHHNAGARETAAILGAMGLLGVAAML